MQFLNFLFGEPLVHKTLNTIAATTVSIEKTVDRTSTKVYKVLEKIDEVKDEFMKIATGDHVPAELQAMSATKRRNFWLDLQRKAQSHANVEQATIQDEKLQLKLACMKPGDRAEYEAVHTRMIEEERIQGVDKSHKQNIHKLPIHRHTAAG